jgi:hypothetical protein
MKKCPNILNIIGQYKLFSSSLSQNELNLRHQDADSSIVPHYELILESHLKASKLMSVK